jgi:hypothetical protein
VFDKNAVAAVISRISIVAVAPLIASNVPDRAVGSVLECYGLAFIVTCGATRKELVWLTALGWEKKLQLKIARWPRGQSSSCDRGS